MDPISLIFTLEMQSPGTTLDAVDCINRPGQVASAQLESSVADFAREVINCFHRSARFSSVEVLGAPWPTQPLYGAEQSSVLRVHFMGISGARYFMDVAAMAKGRQYRTAVIGETSLIKYNKNCALERWVQAG